MTDRTNELETFKTAIDLRAYAADAFGFELDVKASSPGSSVMRDPDGSKIVVAIDRSDGHYVWFQVGSDEGGSIIDLAQRRGVGSLGHVRRALRPYIGQSPEISVRSSFTKLQPVERDIAAVRARWESIAAIEDGRHGYLNTERHLPEALLAHPRFAGRVRVDDRSNAVFPHHNRDGVCGFELKNDGFTGFAKGGAKALWCSHTTETDHRLVIAESAIDALSYAAIHGIEDTRFISLAGQVSPEQIELVRSAMQKLPVRVPGSVFEATAGSTPSEVVLAMDNDLAGDRLVAQFTELFEAVGRQDHLTLRVVRPEIRGHDWNKVLQEESSPSPPPPETDSPSVG